MCEIKHRYEEDWHAIVHLPPGGLYFSVSKLHSDCQAHVEQDTFDFTMTTRFKAERHMQFYDDVHGEYHPARR